MPFSPVYKVHIWYSDRTHACWANKILTPKIIHYPRVWQQIYPFLFREAMFQHKPQKKERTSSNPFPSSIGTTTLRWVSACSTVVEHSQQGGLIECHCQQHIKPPTWRRTRDLECSNFRHKRPPASEAMRANLAAEGGTMGEKWPRNFAESGNFHVTFGFFYMP
jgi:hypothetical protein